MASSTMSNLRATMGERRSGLGLLGDLPDRLLLGEPERTLVGEPRSRTGMGENPDIQSPAELALRSIGPGPFASSSNSRRAAAPTLGALSREPGVLEKNFGEIQFRMCKPHERLCNRR